MRNILFLIKVTQWDSSCKSNKTKQNKTRQAKGKPNTSACCIQKGSFQFATFGGQCEQCFSSFISHKSLLVVSLPGQCSVLVSRRLFFVILVQMASSAPSLSLIPTFLIMTDFSSSFKTNSLGWGRSFYRFSVPCLQPVLVPSPIFSHYTMNMLAATCLSLYSD